MWWIASWNSAYLHETAAYIKERAPEAFIILSFNVQPDGFTTAGRMIRDLCKAAEEDPNVDAVGMNCMTTARHMVDLLRKIGPLNIPISVMPNASYPTVRGNRSCYDGDPGYFAAQMAVLRDEGAWILGGCCGTTPEYTAATAKALKAPAHIRMEYPLQREKIPQSRPNPFWDVLCDPDRKAIAVELDPPEGADLSKFMTGARELRAKDVDIITIADCPVARVRVDSSLMACKLHRELGMSALPHMTCRDRNLNATQALLLGLCAEGIGNVLVVTGDPIPNASRDEVKSVYNFNSRRLIRYIRGLNEAVLPTPFHIFAALNVNARNFRIQLEMAKEKEENGADAFLTQPVLSPQAAENLMLARETLKGKLLGGIMPVVSQRNALFMNSEISGDHSALRERGPGQGRRTGRRNLRRICTPDRRLGGRLLSDDSLWTDRPDCEDPGPLPGGRTGLNVGCRRVCTSMCIPSGNLFFKEKKTWKTAA